MGCFMKIKDLVDMLNELDKEADVYIGLLKTKQDTALCDITDVQTEDGTVVVINCVKSNIVLRD